MGLRIKPNCRADFDPAEFSVVCGNDRAAWLLGDNSAREVSPPRNFIDAAMKYYDKTQFGRDHTPGDPQRFHNVNSLVWRCGAAGVRALPVLTAHDISLLEQ